MKVAGNEVKSIEVLKPKKIEERFDKFLKELEFPQSVLDYIEDNEWISIPNKNLYFNSEMMACYPNFNNNFQDINYVPLKNYDENLNMIKTNAEYSKYGIDWDIQTVRESKNSFCGKDHPLQSNNGNRHPIQGYDCFVCKNRSGEVRSYENYRYNTQDGWSGLLVPIFRLGRKEDHDAFNTDGMYFDYSLETITLLFILNNLIPDFNDEEINNEYRKIYDSIQKYKIYIEKFELDESEKVISKFNLDKVAKEIASGDHENIFGENRLKFTLKNGDTIELSFSKGEITSEGDYAYKNGDKEVCSYKRAANGDFLRTGKSTLTKANKDVEELIYKDGVPQGESEYRFANGDKETRIYEDGVLQGESNYRFVNGEQKIRTYQDGIFQGKSEYIYLNGDKELRTYKDGVLQDDSEYIYKNGDKELRSYKDGVLQGDSEYIYKNGDRETRTYVDGKLAGEAVFYLVNGDESKRYWYEGDKKRDITAVYKILNVDKIRVNLNPYDENILTDPNRGHWDLYQVEDTGEIEAGIGKTIYGRDPKKDIKRGGIVGIDFGTKSTVVVFQDNNNRTLPMRISGENLYLDVKDKDYENPTVIEFLDIDKFMNSYNEKAGRPDTRWENVMVSYTAFNHLLTGTSEEFSTTLSDLKQWAGGQSDTIVVRDKKGVEKVFQPYMELKDGDMDPIELYAYYIGSYINNMRNGIYLEYFLSFPVTYEKAIREKILQSFERGIKKSLPISILEDETVMKKFKVRHGANEPAAYAVCALQEYQFEPDEDETVHYGVFDFGGGTADFDFGIWKPAEDERSFDYELTHFGAGGDRYLGGENILKELAYTVLKESENLDLLKREKISFARPEWCERFPGDEIVVDNSPEAKLNIRIVMEKLRPIWENSQDSNFQEEKIKVNLYAKDGSAKNGVEIAIPYEKLEGFIEAKIERGIENFFIALKKAMKNETVKKINIFLAGNSCKHPKVMELFEKHKGDFEGEIEIFPALGTEEAYKKMKEREIEIDPEDRTNPTGKTGVAYGIIDSRAGGRIDIKNLDEENNIDNEINFKYYVGYEGRKKLKIVLGPENQYEQFVYYINVTADVFDLYYSSLPEAMESKMPIDKAVRKRIELADEYPGAKIYIKAVSPDTLNYVVTEKDVEEKEYLEEGEIKLD